MKKIKEILRAIDANTAAMDSLQIGSHTLPLRFRHEVQLQRDLEVAVRQHVLDLEEAVGCLRSNLRTQTTEMTGRGGFTYRTIVDIRDVERLEEL